MIITTKTGDKGSTSLYNGQRVQKDDARIELNGEIDELNALLGLCKAAAGYKQPFEDIQHQLMDVMTIVANNGTARPETLDKLRQSIDRMEARIAQAGQGRHFDFVLPGLNMADAAIHMARAKARTCERRMVTLTRSMGLPPLLLVYLNRLSDFLFALIA